MNHSSGGVRSGAIFGIILILVGALLLLERVFDFNLTRHFWPGMLILAGSAMLAQRGSFHPVGSMLVLLGIFFELQKFGIIDFHLRQLWPLFLIAWGGLMLLRALRPRGCDQRWADSLDNTLAEWALFGGISLRSSATQFTGGSLMVVCGGIEIDFTGARIGTQPAVLSADALFGGIKLLVPPDWRVTVHGIPLFGGFESRTLPPREGGTPQHLVVKGVAIFGGVDIKTVSQ